VAERIVRASRAREVRINRTGEAPTRSDTLSAMAIVAGARLGPYELVERIGAGGMGEVWRARDPRLRRDVAIKVVLQSLAADGDAVRRFEREARAAAALSHPNIVAIHDIGEADGRPYLVNELLRGRTLREMLAEGRPSPARSTAIALEMARALVAAHRAGVVHRDLKPENVFVTEEGAVKILDFGLASLGAASEEAANSLRTGADVLLGTVGYIAPEHVRGEPTGAPADVFALGCVLFESLAGERAFRRESVASTLHAIAYEEPPAVERLAAEAPLSVIELLTACLAKDPAARPTAAAVVRALESSAVEGPTILESRSRSAPAGAFGRATGARPRAVALVASVALALGVVVAALLVRDGRAPGAEEPAAAPAAPTVPPAQGVERGTTDEEAWKLYLRGRHEWQKRGPALLEARDLFKQAVDRDPTFARAWLGLADTYALLHDYAAMSTEETFPKAKAAAEKALALDPSLSGAHVVLAYIAFYFDRDWTAAEREFRAALALDPGDAKAHQWFAEFLTSQGRAEEALREIREAQRLDPLAPMTFAQEVWILGFVGRPEEAIQRAERAALEFADFGPLHAYRALASIAAGRAEDARRLLDDPQAAKASPVHPLWLAYAEAALGREAEATARLAGAVAQYGDDYLNAYYRAYALTRLGRTESALDALALAIDRREEQVVWINVDPHLAALRQEPRFAELLRRAGFGA
jgi:Tfp pilus assembly protein PilF